MTLAFSLPLSPNAPANPRGRPPATLAFPAPAPPKARRAKPKTKPRTPEDDADLQRKLDRLAYQYVSMQAKNRAEIERLKARNKELRDQLKAERQRSR